MQTTFPFISRDNLINYTKMSNDFLLDPDLTPQAKGTLAIILSNKDDWRIYPEEIARRSKVSKSATLGYFRELEKAGYMRTIRKNIGYKKGARYYRFASDYKMDDKFFNAYVLEKFEEWFHVVELPMILASSVDN